jgi:hypothetical protein
MIKYLNQDIQYEKTPASGSLEDIISCSRNRKRKRMEEEERSREQDRQGVSYMRCPETWDIQKISGYNELGLYNKCGQV